MDPDLRMLLLAGLVVLLSKLWLQSGRKQPIPALVGSSGFLSSYAGAYKYFVHSFDIVERGYREKPDGVFRVPRLFRWDYVVNGAARIAEVIAAPEDVLSFQHGAEDIIQGDYTMGPELTSNPYHQHTIRTHLTRNLGRCFPDVRDEIVSAFDEVLKLEGNDWKPISVLPNIMQVVARTSNRIFVGVPLCRNQEYLDLAISYTVTVFTRGQLIAMVPKILKPILAPLISTRRSTRRRALKFLAPVINDRLAKEAALGKDWADKPNDFISWLLEGAEGSERRAPEISQRLLTTNMAAIHTSSNALTAALFDLTTYPEHILPMREEAERVIRAEGWTKNALGSMHKIDSFLRESQRLTGIGPLGLMRKVVGKEGFTFSDGTHIPRGSFLGASGRAVQIDAANYDAPDIFDGFRFSRKRDTLGAASEGGGGGGFKHHMISTGTDHLVFGHGAHACPGRFFAATELKAMLAHILIEYDVRAEVEGVRPPDFNLGMIAMPNATANIWMRKRQDV
ncbi:cytochrome P450 [Mycena crocata]|nr:cytochrome P450 [Mycena crocata]